MSLYVGRVIKVHQHDHSLDIQLVYDGSRLTAVPLLSPMITTSSGSVDMHHPEGNEWNAAGSPTRDIYVVVSKTDSGFIALGFLAPQVNQMAFDRKNFKVDRHASDVYHTINKDGDIEIFHPSGTIVRIGTTTDHEDLTGQDFDRDWKITRNTEKSVYVVIENKSLGSHKASFCLTPDGDFMIDAVRDVRIRSTGDTSVDASGGVQIKAGGSVKVEAGGSVQIDSGGSVLVNASGGSIVLKSATGVKVI
jgi:hypothetical protein